ncbi:malate:quinone oxidoreductase, partial [Enterobacter kobei]|nr:malate:quinone oxidoreductase [Enterobacter kobei]
MFVSAATHAEADTSKKTDFLLIGGGIMSASLGTWLQALQPDWDLTMVE